MFPEAHPPGPGVFPLGELMKHQGINKHQKTCSLHGSTVDGVQKAGGIGWLWLPATHLSCLQNETATQQHRAKTPRKPIQIIDLLDFPDHTLHQPQEAPGSFCYCLCHRDGNKPERKTPFRPSEALCFRFLNTLQ